jgi:hypothetical protein
LTYEVFPGIDKEISKFLDFSEEEVTLWRHGDFTPTEQVQESIISFLHSKISCYVDDNSDRPNNPNDLVLYRPDSTILAQNSLYQEVSIQRKLAIYIRTTISKILSSLKTSNINPDNLRSLVSQASSNRKNILSFKTTKQIAKCNKQIVSAIRDGQYSTIYMVGERNPTNVDIAKNIKKYLLDAGFKNAEILFGYSNVYDSSIYIEIGLEDVR